MVERLEAEKAAAAEENARLSQEIDLLQIEKGALETVLPARCVPRLLNTDTEARGFSDES